MTAHPSVVTAGRIGPNVVIQTAASLATRLGDDAANRALLLSTGHALSDLPREMVEEELANALVRHLLASLGVPLARDILADAGRRTGDYLLRHRIPGLARAALPRLPAALGLRLLLAAISRHTWTFAGSAQVRITHGDPALISIAGCPICRGLRSHETVCDFYSGTFARLAQALLGPKAWAEEVSCAARGDPLCRFLISSGA